MHCAQAKIKKSSLKAILQNGMERMNEVNILRKKCVVAEVENYSIWKQIPDWKGEKDFENTTNHISNPMTHKRGIFSKTSYFKSTCIEKMVFSINGSGLLVFSMTKNQKNPFLGLKKWIYF